LMRLGEGCGDLHSTVFHELQIGYEALVK
jgi:hypothetical protein